MKRLSLLATALLALLLLACKGPAGKGQEEGNDNTEPALVGAHFADRFAELEAAARESNRANSAKVLTHSTFENVGTSRMFFLTVQFDLKGDILSCYVPSEKMAPGTRKIRPGYYKWTPDAGTFDFRIADKEESIFRDTKEALLRVSEGTDGKTQYSLVVFLKRGSEEAAYYFEGTPDDGTFPAELLITAVNYTFPAESEVRKATYSSKPDNKADCDILLLDIYSPLSTTDWTGYLQLGLVVKAAASPDAGVVAGTYSGQTSNVLAPFTFTNSAPVGYMTSVRLLNEWEESQYYTLVKSGTVTVSDKGDKISLKASLKASGFMESTTYDIVVPEIAFSKSDIVRNP